MLKEIFRKSIHLLLGIFLLTIIYFFGRINSLQIIAIIFIIGLILAILIKNKIKIEFLNKIILLVEREHEKHLPGKAALIFFATTIILLTFFSNIDIILISLSTVIFADSLAAIVGKKFGKYKLVSKKHWQKTLAGTLTCFIVCSLILLLIAPLPLAVFIALVATIIEFAPINDNIGIPLAVAILLKLFL